MNIPKKSVQEQRHFFEECKDLYEQATEKTGIEERRYRIADTVVSITFAGDSLLPLLVPALSHLQVKNEVEADAKIFVWDSESSGVNMADPPCKPSHYTDRGDIWGFDSKRIKTAFHWSEFSVNVMDLDRKEAVYWVRSPEHLPYWTSSSPFRTIFHWWMEENGCQLMHAAAVGTEDGALLITGKGGTGKSTTAVSSLANGMKYLADDYLIVQKGPNPKVYSLYCTAKINRNERGRFPDLSKYAAEPIEENQEKDVLFLYPEFEEQLCHELPLRSILTPHFDQASDKSSFSDISFWRIHRAMSFTTMSQLPGAGTHTHDYFKELCNLVPCFSLNLGKIPENVPLALRNHLKSSDLDLKPKDSEESDYPLVSIIIPVHNGEKYIREAIQNISDQNYPATEIIVVNDGSTDGTDSIVRNLEIDIRYFDREQNGPSTARNTGIKDASGEYIAFLDVDDLWPENNLKLLVDLMQENLGVDVIRGYAQLFRDSENGEREFLGNPKESFQYYIGAGLYRSDVFSKVGLFDPTLFFGEDTDWYNRAIERKISIKWLEEVTLFVRRHGENMTEGKTIIELNKLKTIKRALDRKRAAKQALDSTEREN